jgi:hypothetical protein
MRLQVQIRELVQPGRVVMLGQSSYCFHRKVFSSHANYSGTGRLGHWAAALALPVHRDWHGGGRAGAGGPGGTWPRRAMTVAELRVAITN